MANTCLNNKRQVKGEDHFSLTCATGPKAHSDMVKQTPEEVLQLLAADTLSELCVHLFALLWHAGWLYHLVKAGYF